MNTAHRIFAKMLIGLTLCLSAPLHARAETASLGTNAIINLPLGDVWNLFTSETGLRDLGFAQPKVDLQLGGAWQGGGSTSPLPDMDNRILSMDPGHMLTFKASDASSEQWSVLYFAAMGPEMTQVRWLEFFPEAQRSMVSAHQQQVRALFDVLIRRYAPECDVCKAERQAGR